MNNMKLMWKHTQAFQRKLRFSDFTCLKCFPTPPLKCGILFGAGILITLIIMMTSILCE